MNPVEAGRAMGLEFSCGGDIRRDHEFLDELMSVETDPRRDRRNMAELIDLDLALRHIEIQWLAALPFALQGAIGGIKRFQDRLQQGAGHVVGTAVDCRLRLFIAEVGG